MIMACFYSDPFSHSFRRIDYKLKRKDSTKSLLIKTEQLLRIEDHDFAMRPGFGGQDALFICSSYQSPSQSGKSQLEWSFLINLIKNGLYHFVVSEGRMRRCYHLSVRGKAARGDFDRASVVLNSDMTQIVQNTN